VESGERHDDESIPHGIPAHRRDVDAGAEVVEQGECTIAIVVQDEPVLEGVRTTVGVRGERGDVVVPSYLSHIGTEGPASPS